jgi:outer membrane receptor protein involved in Fe transport
VPNHVHQDQRFDRCERAGLGGPPLPPSTYPLFAQVLGIIPHSVEGSLSESNFSPLVNVEWQFADRSMAYLSWAQGYKSGGFDARSNKPPPPRISRVRN